MGVVKDRAKGFDQIIDKAEFVLKDRPLQPDQGAAQALDDVSRGILGELTPRLQTATWQRTELEEVVGALAREHELGLGKLAKPLRAALSGRLSSPSVFDMMIVLGRDETIARIDDAITRPGAFAS